ncbi:MAG: TRASH domain-containing protein [Bdellovibrionales bacterium]|nr:TRASH domain-containing protein [Bdellovibrionales bacterium]
MNQIRTIVFLAVISISLNLMAFAAFAKEKLNVVPTNEVCMVNNIHFSRPQIPVSSDGQTYYGCCENCKKTLKEDPKSRTAQDPITKHSVDKANAVIAARADGSVLYFESTKTLNMYSETGKK